MSRPNLRIVAENGIRREPAHAVTMDAPVAPVQLSLFDPDASSLIVCFAMSSIHGKTFADAMTSMRPRSVVDLRKIPHFDLVALGRSRAFALFEALGSRYIHVPVGLRPSNSDEDRDLRDGIERLFARIEKEMRDPRGPHAFLIGAENDAGMLADLLRDKPHPEDGQPWSVRVRA